MPLKNCSTTAPGASLKSWLKPRAGKPPVVYGPLDHGRQQHGSHSQASIGRLVTWVTPGIAEELRVTWVTRGDAGGWTAEVARAYLDRTNFNGFKGDGAYSRLDRPIRIDTAGGRTIRIVWIVKTLLALSTMLSQAANFFS